MDIVAHGLWAGAAGEWLRRRSDRSRRTVAWTVVLGTVPDLISLLPVIAWSVFQPEPWRLLSDYVMATPGAEPPLPALVDTLSHHAHCIMHSAIIALGVTVLAWRFEPALLVPLVGWWLHIATDVPTHSSDYYAVPFLYPFTYWGVDGVAWKTPWLLVSNYAALALVYYWMLVRSRRVPG
jgi:hypothetical protein